MVEGKEDAQSKRRREEETVALLLAVPSRTRAIPTIHPSPSSPAAGRHRLSHVTHTRPHPFRSCILPRHDTSLLSASTSLPWFGLSASLAICCGLCYAECSASCLACVWRLSVLLLKAFDTGCSTGAECWSLRLKLSGLVHSTSAFSFAQSKTKAGHFEVAARHRR